VAYEKKRAYKGKKWPQKVINEVKNDLTQTDFKEQISHMSQDNLTLPLLA
jgi:hypothetical protein